MYVPLAMKPEQPFYSRTPVYWQRVSDHCSNHSSQGGCFVEQSNLVRTTQVLVSLHTDQCIHMLCIVALRALQFDHSIVRRLLSKEQTSLVFICQLFSSDDLPNTDQCTQVHTTIVIYSSVVYCVAMATSDTPVLDELCLSLLFDLLHSLDGAHCKGSTEGEQICINRNQSSASRHTVA